MILIVKFSRKLFATHKIPPAHLKFQWKLFKIDDNFKCLCENFFFLSFLMNNKLVNSVIYFPLPNDFAGVFDDFDDSIKIQAANGIFYFRKP